MPFDFDPSRDRLPASPPEAPSVHRTDDARPVFDWAAGPYEASDPTRVQNPAPSFARAATSIPPAPPAPVAPPGPPTAAWPSPPSFPPASPPPGSPPGGGAWATTQELPPSSPPSRTPRNAVIVLLVVAALIASAFVGAGARNWLSTSSVTAAPTPSTDGTLSDQTGGAEKPSTGSGSNGSANGSTSATAPDWTAVTNAVVPGVVDIEARVSGGVAAGTGMVLTGSGEILTNNHVVEGARQIVVTVVSTGQDYSASIVGTDPAEDVAVLQLADASGLTTIPLGDSDGVAVADPVAAIGNAGGVGGQPDVATGQVVALHQQITAGDQQGNDSETLSDMIQVDAEVVAGDSGGPLADSDGKVIGMNTAAAGSNGHFRTTVNQAFAIPINRALSIAEQLASGSSNGSSGGSSSSSGSNSSSRGFLGVKVQTGSAGGAEVVGVVTGGAAAAAGVEAGDVIVGVDGSSVETADDLTAALQSAKTGDRVQLTWQAMDGRTRQATVELQAA